MSQVLQLNRSFWKNFLSSSEKGGHLRVAKCATRCLPIVWKVQTTLTISPLEPNHFCDLLLLLNSKFLRNKKCKISLKRVFTFIYIMIWPFVYVWYRNLHARKCPHPHWDIIGQIQMMVIFRLMVFIWQGCPCCMNKVPTFVGLLWQQYEYKTCAWQDQLEPGGPYALMGTIF